MSDKSKTGTNKPAGSGPQGLSPSEMKSLKAAVEKARRDGEKAKKGTFKEI